MLRAALLAVAPATLILTLGAAAPQDTRSTPTFTRDVAPIVFAECAACHRPGGPAPFSLLAYDDVRRRARQMAEVTGTGYMPPWPPAPGHGEFEGERRLTPAEIDTLARWASAGAPEGDARDLPAAPEHGEGWQLGAPDLVLEPSAPFRMPADGPDRFHTFVVPVRVDAVRHVRAVEFRPRNPRAVHHAVLRLTPAGAAGERTIEGEGMVASEEDFVSPDGHLLGWAPGYSPNVSPPDMAWRLQPGTAMAIEVHVQATGKAEEVRPSVGLYFTDREATRTPFGLQLGTYTVDIPPGDGAYVVQDRYTLPVPVDVLAVYPHAHYRGKDLRAWAELPDGSERRLIHIPDWDFNWQNAYRYREPVRLPRGATIAMRYVYDNSAANPRNPVQPPVRARYGGQSADEMANLWLQVVPVSPADLPALGADYAVKSAERRVDGYAHLVAERPDHEARRRALGSGLYDLGVLRQNIGAKDGAAAAFRRAIETLPSAPQPYDALAWLFATDRSATPAQRTEALQAAHRAVALTGRRDPSALDTLAAAHAAAGDFDSAVAEAEAALALAEQGGQANLIDAIRGRLALYRQGQPFYR